MAKKNFKIVVIGGSGLIGTKHVEIKLIDAGDAPTDRKGAV